MKICVLLILCCSVPYITAARHKMEKELVEREKKKLLKYQNKKHNGRKNIAVANDDYSYYYFDNTPHYDYLFDEQRYEKDTQVARESIVQDLKKKTNEPRIKYLVKSSKASFPPNTLRTFEAIKEQCKQPMRSKKKKRRKKEKEKSKKSKSIVSRNLSRKKALAAKEKAVEFKRRLILLKKFKSCVIEKLVGIEYIEYIFGDDRFGSNIDYFDVIDHYRPYYYDYY